MPCRHLIRFMNQPRRDLLLVLLFTVCADHTDVQYSKSGRTQVINAVVKTVRSLITKNITYSFNAQIVRPQLRYTL